MPPAPKISFNALGISTLAEAASFFSTVAEAITRGELLSFDFGETGLQKAEEVVRRKSVITRQQYMRIRSAGTS